VQYLAVCLVGKMESLHDFLVKLAWKPELKLCLDQRKHQWWCNHETESEERSCFHFVLFFAVVISTKKKVVGSHYDVSLVAACYSDKSISQSYEN
jgi:hypothetical protein